MITHLSKTGITKKILVVLLVLAAHSSIFAQSVAINTDKSAPDASAILDIKSIVKGLLIPRLTMAQRNAVASPATGLLIFQTDAVTGYYYYNSTAWVTLAGSAGATNYWTQNGSSIYTNTTGNVGIGTSNPSLAKLTVQTGVGFGFAHTDGNITVSSYIGLGGGWLGTKSNHPLYFYTNNSMAQISLLQNGNMGVGTDAPAFKMDIAGRIRLQTQSDGNTAGLWLNDPANTNAIAFVGIADASTVGIYGNNSGWGLAVNTNTGNVGIQTLAPANKLQIGSLGNTGFAGNDIAIGNGTNALGIYQSNAATLIGSTTDIILKPRNDGTGKVGINTSSPRATLEVAGYADIPMFYYNYINGIYTLDNVRNCRECTAGVSIYANRGVMAQEFDAFSDVRIKNIRGTSNSATDLKIINSLEITDYSLKDYIQNGNKLFKKVIAQQVEQYYPQVVSKHTDFIPNVYQVSSSIKKNELGYLLSFTGHHNISSKAKKLRVLMTEGEGVQQFDIVAIPSDKQVIIKATDLKTDKIFVYGEEVDDFRTVDYEGLTTLNISATQELSKLLATQNKKIAMLIKDLMQKEKRLTVLETKQMLTKSVLQ